MAKLIYINSHKDSRGTLSVVQDEIGFNIKRIYYVYNSCGLRGGHKHKVAKQALICLSGACTVTIKAKKNEEIISETYVLNNPEKCLILDPDDWHTFEFKNQESILLVLASNRYSPNDYILEI
jgi:hypothetical protein